MHHRHLLATVVLVLLSACGQNPADAPAASRGHLFADAIGGIALDLPPRWVGRYRVSDSTAHKVAGLERELAFRFVRGDSTAESTPLFVLRVFRNAEWLALRPDSAAQYGPIIAHDPARTMTIATAAANPLAEGSADALAFDSLMYALRDRPLRASLRAHGVSSQRGPAGPGSSFP